MKQQKSKSIEGLQFPGQFRVCGVYMYNCINICIRKVHIGYICMVWGILWEVWNAPSVYWRWLDMVLAFHLSVLQALWVHLISMFSGIRNPTWKWSGKQWGTPVMCTSILFSFILHGSLGFHMQNISKTQLWSTSGRQQWLIKPSAATPEHGTVQTYIFCIFKKLVGINCYMYWET